MIALVDPGTASRNLGDKIISASLQQELHCMLPESRIYIVPMHGSPTPTDIEAMQAASRVLIAGTNLLSNYMRFRSAWEWKSAAVRSIRGKATLFGPGWWQYQVGGVDPISGKWLKNLLNCKVSSVRDEYSASRLRSAGIEALNTTCPTLWRVTAQQIPLREPKVVATFTDYNTDLASDRYLLDRLSARFDQVEVWPQGAHDEEYVREALGWSGPILERSLSALDESLSNGPACYIGLRLHAGIRAMQLGIPTTIIGIDNRSIEIGRDISMCVVPRSRIARVDDYLIGGQRTLNVPLENIASFQQQWTSS